MAHHSTFRFTIEKQNIPTAGAPRLRVPNHPSGASPRWCYCAGAGRSRRVDAASGQLAPSWECISMWQSTVFAAPALRANEPRGNHGTPHSRFQFIIEKQNMHTVGVPRLRSPNHPSVSVSRWLLLCRRRQIALSGCRLRATRSFM